MITTIGFFPMGYNSMYVKDATLLVSPTLTLNGSISCNISIGTFNDGAQQTIESFSNNNNMSRSFDKSVLVFDSNISDDYERFCAAIENAIIDILEQDELYTNIAFSRV